MKKFPTLSYTLIIADKAKEAQSDWKLPNVKNFYLPIPNPYKKDGDIPSWRSIFFKCGLLNPHIKPANPMSVLINLAQLFAEKKLPLSLFANKYDKRKEVAVKILPTIKTVLAKIEKHIKTKKHE